MVNSCCKYYDTYINESMTKGEIIHFGYRSKELPAETNLQKPNKLAGAF